MALPQALRSLFRRPGFAAVAILLLALGAGANAAVFSVVRGVLLRPLPFAQPDRLVAVGPGEFFSNRDIGYLREHMRALEQVAGLSPGWMMGLVPDGGEAVKVTGAKVSDNLFAMLGARPAVGRVIEPGDGPKPVALLAHGLWSTRFSGDAGVVGRTVGIDGQPYTVIGVMPPGFEVLEPGTDVWTPLPFDPGAPNHRATFSQVLARLEANVRPETANRELAQLVPRMRRELSLDDEWGRTLALAPLRGSIVGGVRQPLLVLLGAVGMILLLASVNLATLVLGRSLARSAEFALRSSLGATRSRLVRQLLLEQGVVALLGAGAGLATARVLLPALVARIPPEVPRTGQIRLDFTVLAVVLAASVAASLLASLVPALIATRPALAVLLREAGPGASGRRGLTLSVLVAVQVALAVVLGIGAGLMLRTMWNLQRVDPGFTAEGVITFRLQTTSVYRALDRGLPYLEEVVSRVKAVPGVVSVGAINHLPMSGYSWRAQAWPEDRPPDPRRTAPSAAWRFIGWDYFQTMRVPLRHGRGFAPADRTGSPGVAIVNDSFARRHFGQASAAVGRRLAVTSGAGREVVEIVGVVGDVRHRGLDQPPEDELYRPLAQTFMFPMAVVVRTSVSSGATPSAIRRAAAVVDRRVAVAEFAALPGLLADSLAKPRLLASLLTAFAAVGLLLGLVGVYGVAAHRVRQREREIGIRLALGAPPGRMAGWVVRQTLAMVAAGLAAGVPLALALAGLMSTLVFGVGTRDPLTCAGLPALVVLAATAAAWVPARRASRLDPARTIRAG
jgi:predicted permease